MEISFFNGTITTVKATGETSTTLLFVSSFGEFILEINELRLN